MLTLAAFETRYPNLTLVLGKIGDWLHDRAVAHDRAAQLKSLNNEHDFDRAARDLGMSRHELGIAMALSPGFVTLLARRMALPLARRLALQGLDRRQLRRTDAARLEQLATRCTGCTHHARCETDLDLNPGDQAWKRYCPNTKEIEALGAA
jgi:hypothetical protein